jgi:hypothetical protein
VAAGIYQVHPSARLNSAAMGAFKAWIEEHFKDGPPWRNQG